MDFCRFTDGERILKKRVESICVSIAVDKDCDAGFLPRNTVKRTATAVYVVG